MKRYITTIILLLTLAWSAGAQNHTSVLDVQSQGLRNIIVQQKDLLRNGKMTPERFQDLLKQYNNHFKNNPKERPQTLMRMGSLYQTVIPVQLRDPEKSITYYRDILQMLDPNDSLNRSLIYHRLALVYSKMGANGIRSALRHLTDAAKMNPYNARYLGDFYLFGWGVYQDLFIAEEYYAMCLRAGSETSAEFLVIMDYILEQDKKGVLDSVACSYLEKALFCSNVEQDWEQSYQWLSMSCERGFVPALHIMGSMLAGGFHKMEGAQGRPEYWYRLSAEQNYSPALYDLAMMNDDIAMLRKAADLNYVPAIRQLGDYYARGHGNIKKDLKEAAVWYKVGFGLYNGVCQSKIDSVMRVGRFSKDQQAMIDNRYEQEMERRKGEINDMMSLLSFSKHFNHPILSESFFNQMGTSDLKPEDDPAYTSSIIKAYRTAYDILANQLKAMSIHEGDYKSHNGASVQRRMKAMREHTEKLGVNVITQSMWETWNGQ